MLVNLLLAILSGILLFIIHPGFSMVWLAPFVLAPLLVAVAREWRPKYRFLLGYVTGLVYWSGMCYWIQFVIAEHGGMPGAASWAAFTLFCVGCGINLAVFGMLAGVVIHKPYAIPAVTMLWIGAERIPAAFNFTWLKLGNAAIDMGIPMRLAPYTGVYGVSFVFALMSAGLASVLLRRSRKELAWMLLLTPLYLLPSLPLETAAPEAAAVVQPNLPEDKRWTQPEVEEMENRLGYLSLTSALSSVFPRPNLILWPEAPAPLYYTADAGLRDRVGQLARASKTRVLLGTVTYLPNGSPLNSAVMVGTNGDLLGRYDKLNLVPFGEYVPAAFSFANKITGEIGDFVPGQEVKVLGGDVGVFICYESAFPQLVRQFAERGATVFTNLSNDGYFGTTHAREQHFSLVRMRAVENRRWILRVTNNGITASVNPSGRVVERMAPFVETSGRLPYARIAETTWYTRHGDWFAWLSLALGLALCLYSQVPVYQAPVRGTAARRGY